jgi:hypothetical protein
VARKHGAVLLSLTFGVRHPTLSVSFHAAIEQEHDHEQEQEERGRRSSPKNYRPPHPIGVKGGCSPQNNRRKLSTLVSEVLPAGNKILHKIFTKFSAVLGLGIGINKGGTAGKGLRKRALRFLVLHA